MTVLVLAFFGLIEFSLRVAISPLLLFLAVLEEIDFTESMTPYLWKLLDAHLRKW